MGDFRIVIEGVGNHGCQRGVADGDKVSAFCGNSDCVDCIMRAHVSGLASVASVSSAVLHHWPDSAGEVQDDLVTRVRSGSFGPLGPVIPAPPRVPVIPVPEETKPPVIPVPEETKPTL